MKPTLERLNAAIRKLQDQQKDSYLVVRAETISKLISIRRKLTCTY